MEKGYRKKLILEHTNKRKGNIFIVKRKKWESNTLTMFANPRCNDGFIIGNPLIFKEMGVKIFRRIQFLHELGHFGVNGTGIHFIDENWVTIYGFFRYKRLFEKTKNLKIRHLLKFLKFNLKYTLWKK